MSARAPPTSVSAVLDVELLPLDKLVVLVVELLLADDELLPPSEMTIAPSAVVSEKSAWTVWAMVPVAAVAVR